jgi:hypothetical protein
MVRTENERKRKERKLMEGKEKETTGMHKERNKKGKKCKRKKTAVVFLFPVVSEMV